MKPPRKKPRDLQAPLTAALALIFIALSLTAGGASGQSTSLYIPSRQEYDRALEISNAQMQKATATRRVNGGIEIDGVLNESDWHAAPVST